MVEELKAETEAEKPVPTPGLSAIIVKRIQHQVSARLDVVHDLKLTLTHVAEYDNPKWPGSYRVDFEGKLTTDQRRKLQKDSQWFPVVGLGWFVFKPLYPLANGEVKSAKDAAEPDASPQSSPDPKDMRIAELEAEIARLKIERQPSMAAAIREEIRTFPAHPEMEAKIEPDINERKLTDYLNSGWTKFDGSFQGSAYNIVFIRARQNSQPGEPATVFAEAASQSPIPDLQSPEKRSVKPSRIIESAVPVVFANLMRANPLIEQVWTRGADAVFDDMMAEAHNRALDFIFARLDAQRLILASSEGDEL